MCPPLLPHSGMPSRRGHPGQVCLLEVWGLCQAEDGSGLLHLPPRAPATPWKVSCFAELVSLTFSRAALQKQDQMFSSLKGQAGV